MLAHTQSGPAETGAVPGRDVLRAPSCRREPRRQLLVLKEPAHHDAVRTEKVHHHGTLAQELQIAHHRDVRAVEQLGGTTGTVDLLTTSVPTLRSAVTTRPTVGELANRTMTTSSGIMRWLPRRQDANRAEAW
jgi:hypothetical protein